ncbi:MAG: PTS mannose transporter subunit IID [candidate division WOR-3 bacterium]
MIKGIIIGHGEFAKALLNTVEKILGKQEMVEVFSNEKLSCESLAENIKNSVGMDEHEKILFVDLPGGSCAISCLNILRMNKKLKVLCGVNLPMLIEFFLLREKYTVEELVPILLKKAKDNITILGGNVEDNR